MKLFTNKKFVMITAAVLLLTVAVGTTLAFVFTNTDPVENTFKPSKVACAVVENINDTETKEVVSGSPDNIVITKKSDVKIKNTGDTDAYIRVAIVVNWASADGTKVWAMKPVLDTDYTMTLDLANGWVKGKDGFYYYTKPVPAVDDTATDIDETLTGILIQSAALQNGVTPPKGTDDTQYYLSIEIVASAIQSTPSDVVVNQWKTGVSRVNNKGILEIITEAQS